MYIHIVPAASEVVKSKSSSGVNQPHGEESGQDWRQTGADEGLEMNQ